MKRRFGDSFPHTLSPKRLSPKRLVPNAVAKKAGIANNDADETPKPTISAVRARRVFQKE